MSGLASTIMEHLSTELVRAFKHSGHDFKFREDDDLRYDSVSFVISFEGKDLAVFHINITPGVFGRQRMAIEIPHPRTLNSDGASAMASVMKHLANIYDHLLVFGGLEIK
jgi:hypothetical protein